jgi:hypothetical protein
MLPLKARRRKSGPRVKIVTINRNMFYVDGDIDNADCGTLYHLGEYSGSALLFGVTFALIYTPIQVLSGVQALAAGPGHLRSRFLQYQ